MFLLSVLFNGTFSLACIVMDKESGNSRGFGYVTFADPADAEAAKNGLQGWVSLFVLLP